MDDVLNMINIVKVYDNGVMANKGATFSAKKGEIHAVCGENGAGKTTLMKILFGMEQPNEGRILIDGKEVKLTSSNKAIECGIGMVHQHFMLVPSLTVAENVVLGIEPVKHLVFDKSEAIRMTNEISEKYNLKVPVEAKVEDISVGLKQRVEIIKALIKGAKILILDEPTSVLTPQGVIELFTQLKYLRDKGHTIIFISHKLHEVKQLCERITIMRNGRVVSVNNVADVTEADISRMMVGRDVVNAIDKDIAKPTDVLLQVNGLNYNNENGKAIIKDVSFNARRGEILGFAGVEGNGQHELMEILAGMLPYSSGDVKINGIAIKNKSIRQIREMGVAYIPEDRMTCGVAKDLSISQNILAGKHFTTRYTGKFLLKMQNIRNDADGLIKKFQIKCSNKNQLISMLSGGNIQKIVVAREMSGNPDVLVVDQPTQGIDIGTSEFIRNQLVKLRDKNKVILLNTADLNEVLELADSLIVFYNGEIVAYFTDTKKLKEEELGLYMLGIKRQTSEERERGLYA